MARKLLVEIVGDTSSVERAFKSVGSASTSVADKIMHVGKRAIEAAGVLGIGGLTIGLEESVHAAIGAEASQARLDQAFKRAGLSAQASADQLDMAEASGRKLGFTDEQVKDALGSLVTATGDVGKSMTELSVAQDLARFKGIGLTDATKMLTMAQTGSQRAAKQLGISVEPVTSNYDKLKATMGKTIDESEKLQLAHAKLLDKMATGNAVIDAVSEKVRGQGKAFADTAAGGIAQFEAESEHLKVTLGEELLPVVARLATKLSDGVDFVDKFITAVKKLNPVLAANVESQTTAADSTAHTGATMSAATKDALRLQQALDDVNKVWQSMVHIAVSVVNGVESVIGALRRMDETSHKIVLTWANWGKEMGSAIQHLVSVVAGSVGDFFTAAAGIGKSIINGILSGLGNIASSIGSKIHSGLSSAVHFAGGLLHGSGEFMWTKQAIGEPMAHGVIEGWKIGIATLNGVISDNLDSAVVAANTKLRLGLGNLKQYAQSSLLDQATNFLNQQATAAANADTISQYQQAIFAGQAGINHSGSPGDRDFASGVPGFATGGVVGGPIGAPQLIIAHGGETITPPGKGGGVTNHFYFSNYMGDKTELMSLIRNAAASFTRNNGGRSAFA